ncbi:MAG: NAD(P)-dependent alcohol dehydrogenase [Verrucomicrobiales bacterium]|nr:NAD(P)-dependent alcohol dehydrogenase [Verrucomicrobiales bacterium]
MSTLIQAFAATGRGQPLEAFEYEAGPLGAEQVEIAVTHCGICHSDLSMIDNEWGMSHYPLVPGHEVVGVVTEIGPAAKRVQIGQRVGLGWYSGSCMACSACLSGNHHLCAQAEATIVGRHGGFSNKVHAHWAWTTPLPDALDSAKAGPLFCGGATVFNPLVSLNVKPTDRVGVIGIGGLGHMALQFLNKWGCEVTAFTSSDAKRDEALQMGAHQVVNSRDSNAMGRLRGSLDFIVSTVNVPLDWAAILDTLAPTGRLHLVGAVLEPIPLSAFALIPGQKAISGSPVGSPTLASTMVDFCARHGIAPVTEHFPLSRVNDALEHLRSGKARYRIVLENDLG